MTQEEIISMAREAGAATGKPAPNAPEIVFTQCLDIYHFAKLVAEKEREECALRAEEFLTKPETDWDGDFWNQAIERVVEAIRARGQQ